MLLRSSVSIALASLFIVGCGSRSNLRAGQEALLTACAGPEDCDQSDLCAPQVCVDGYCAYDQPIECGEPPECASIACNPDSGQCEVTPLTQDLDRDGFLGPLPGVAYDAPNSCGNDCDDNDASAFPGGVEVCDGVDNDCDGIIDNGELYLTPELTGDLEPVVLASQYDDTSVRGADYGDGTFFTSFLGRVDIRKLDFIQGVDTEGETVFPATRMSQTRGPSFGGDVAWSGSAFGAFWADADGGQNYDVYFGLFDAFGNKLIPDVRVSNAPEYSIRPRLLFDQGRFVGTWNDFRDGTSVVYAQLISADGRLIEGERTLTDIDEGGEHPYLAGIDDRLGLAYMAQNQVLKFRSFDKNLSASTEPIVLSEEANRPRIHAVDKRFVVTWYDSTDLPSMVPEGSAVRGAVLDQLGNILVAPTRLTPEVPQTRAFVQEVVSLGDRFLLLFLANYETERVYSLYGQMMGPNLEMIEPTVLLSDSVEGSSGLEAALSKEGKVGVFFNDYTAVGQSVNFLALGCTVPEEPPIR